MPPKKINKNEEVVEEPVIETKSKGKGKSKKEEVIDPPSEHVPESKTKSKSKKEEVIETPPEPEPVPEPKTKSKSKKISKKEEDNSDEDDDEKVSKTKGKTKKEEIVEKQIEPETKSKGKNKKIIVEKGCNEQEQYELWKQEWSKIVAKIIEHEKVTTELENERDLYVKKMDTFLKNKNGTDEETIFDTKSKLTKPNAKFNVPIKLVDESDDDSDTSDDDSDESDNDATPVEPIKKGKILPKFTASSSNKKKNKKSDSDESE